MNRLQICESSHCWCGELATLHINNTRSRGQLFIPMMRRVCDSAYQWYPEFFRKNVRRWLPYHEYGESSTPISGGSQWPPVPMIWEVGDSPHCWRRRVIFSNGYLRKFESKIQMATAICKRLVEKRFIYKNWKISTIGRSLNIELVEKINVLAISLKPTKLLLVEFHQFWNKI
jgi:hypothetical protein